MGNQHLIANLLLCNLHVMHENAAYDVAVAVEARAHASKACQHQNRRRGAM